MITTIDPSLAVRGKIIAALRGDSTLTAIIPATRIYKADPPSNVVWPYVLLGELITAPQRLDGGNGAIVSGAVHCFVKAVDDPQADAMTINAHVARILDSMDEVAADELDLGIHVTGSQVIRDGAEASARHGFVQYGCSAT